MSDQHDPWDILMGAIKKVPKDEDVWLYLYMQKPHKGSIGKVDVDRNRDLREQVKEYLEEEQGLRNFVEAKVNVRIRGDGNVTSAVIHLPLKTETRVENPATPTPAVAVDTSSIAQQAAAIKATKIALYGECAECHEPRPDCVCEVEEEEEEDCATCGLPESECLGHAAPTTFEVVIDTVAKSERGRELVGDLVEALIDRIRYGRSTPPEVEAESKPANWTVHEGGKQNGGAS